MINPDEESEEVEKPDPWPMSSQSDTSFSKMEKQESRGSVKRREIPVISEPMEMAASTEVETVPIVTGDISKKVKVENEREEQEKKENEQEELKITLKKEEKEEKEPTEENVPRKLVSMDSETEKSILKLRKLSTDYIEKERKKSMELEAITTTSITPDGNDDFEFSDDDNEPFDVPDISL